MGRIMQHLEKRDFTLDKIEIVKERAIKSVDLDKVGEILRRKREEKKWSQFDLGLKSGTNNNLVLYLEQNKYKNPTVKQYDKLARALGMTLSELFAEAEE